MGQSVTLHVISAKLRRIHRQKACLFIPISASFLAYYGRCRCCCIYKAQSFQWCAFFLHLHIVDTISLSLVPGAVYNARTGLGRPEIQCWCPSVASSQAGQHPCPLCLPAGLPTNFFGYLQCLQLLISDEFRVSI